MDEGLFGPDTVTWQVNREAVLLAGGGRALLLQVAHPPVAAGGGRPSGPAPAPRGARPLAGGRPPLLPPVPPPSVAAGVVQHSDYDTDPWGRLYRTLDVVTRIT